MISESRFERTRSLSASALAASPRAASLLASVRLGMHGRDGDAIAEDEHFAALRGFPVIDINHGCEPVSLV